MLKMLVLAATLNLAPEVPKSMNHAVMVDGGLFGWGAPVGSTRIITALHLIRGPMALWQDGRGNGGLADVLCRDQKHDVAVLRVVLGTLPNSYTLAREMPPVQSRVWWRSFLRKKYPTVSRGNYLGEIDDGFGIEMGFAHPGSSGSPVVNDAGELIGIFSAVRADTENDRSATILFPKYGVAGSIFVGNCKIR